ncbi:MAG: hypothetical protein Q8P29_01865 [Candidatus Levybacteria bacterium]|nr:hypothetical protein [Candidatus Levybacteria bacterium]
MKVQSSKFKIQNHSSKLKVLLHTLFICLTFNFALLTFNLDKAEASALSLGIDPPIIVINAIPPTAVTSPLNIQNKSDTQVTLQIQLKSFKAKGENGELEYSKETPEIFKNIQVLDANVPVESTTLGPRQQKSLSLNINIPQDANVSARPPATSSNDSQTDQSGVAGEVGRDYYFSVVFISTNSPPIESSSSINQAGIATNVLLSIGAKEIPKATIEKFSSNIFFEKGPVPFTIRVKNTGIHFIRPMGGITIKNMFGQSIGKLDLANVNVLSDSIRAIPNSIYMQELRLKSNLDTKGKFPVDFRSPIALWKESFLLGLYAATLNISMSNEGPTFARTIYFFAFPFQGLIIIVILVIIIIVVRNRLKLYLTHR